MGVCLPDPVSEPTPTPEEAEVDEAAIDMEHCVEMASGGTPCQFD
jgi:hypothetical protein